MDKDCRILNVARHVHNGAHGTESVFMELPIAVMECWQRAEREKMTGQLLVNFNSGVAQSFEVKEHHRL